MVYLTAQIFRETSESHLGPVIQPLWASPSTSEGDKFTAQLTQIQSLHHTGSEQEYVRIPLELLLGLILPKPEFF